VSYSPSIFSCLAPLRARAGIVRIINNQPIKRFILGKKGIFSIVLPITSIAMASTPFFLTLCAKKQLTHDVYELEYCSEEQLQILPGQYILCDTSGDPKFRRSYSVSWVQ
jgi:hypothetical protein